MFVRSAHKVLLARFYFYKIMNNAIIPGLEDDWISSSIECDKNKKATDAYRQFKSDQELDFYTSVIQSIYNRTYVPRKSICFCVTKPQLREIFAAHYSDRRVQHWVTHRLEPLFEERFVSQGDVSFNCRKGFGVQAAVLRVHDIIEDITENYTKEAYIGKYDLKGFFMSIDKDILWSKLKTFIEENYTNEIDKDTLLYLSKTIIYHCPQKNCRKKGDIRLFDKLPEGKSLFKQPDNKGLPIGNITSQLFANFYMSFFDAFMIEQIEKIGGKYVRFVDDFIIVAPRKNEIKKLKVKARDFLEKELHVTLHPDKEYLQKATHGVKFIGYYIKPHRIYLSNRTWRTLTNKLYILNDYAQKYIRQGDWLEIGDLRILKLMVCSINSCLGFSVRCNRYKRAKEELERFPDIMKLVYVSSTKDKNGELIPDYRKICIHPYLRTDNILFNKFIRQNYGRNQNKYRQTSEDGTCRGENHRLSGENVELQRQGEDNNRS